MAANKAKSDAITFYTYPKLLFAWPLLVFGPLFYFVPESWGWGASLGWMYLFILLLVLMTISVDIERNYAFVWVVIVGLLFFAGRWINDAFEIPLFNAIFDFFEAINAKYDPGFGMALSILLAIPYAVMIVWVRINHRWRITHNEFEHYSFGRADDSLARGAKRVRSTYPDLLELILCGAGTLIVYSATGRQELRRIPHVPMLFLVRKRINSLLEYTAVTSSERDSVVEEEVEAEEYEDGSSAREEGLGEDVGGIGESRDPL